MADARYAAAEHLKGCQSPGWKESLNAFLLLEQIKKAFLCVLLEGR